MLWYVRRYLQMIEKIKGTNLNVLQSFKEINHLANEFNILDLKKFLSYGIEMIFDFSQKIKYSKPHMRREDSSSLF